MQHFLIKSLRFCILFFAPFGAQKSFAQMADFTVSIPSKQGCSPLSINFTDVSTGGIVATRTWDLGNTVIIPNGPATVGANYITAQTYTVTLTVVFTNGVTNSKTDFIIVHPKPVADFKSADSIGCAAHPANFISLSSTTTGTLTNYQWDFGAGGVTGPNPTPNFLYTAAGLYQVSLIVKNNWGCISNAETKPQYIKVFSPPTAYFNVNPYYTCDNSFTATFTNATTGGDPARNTYEWDFGDGSPIETTLNATHLYTITGNYTAILKVKLGTNCVNTYTKQIYVGKPTGTITTFPTIDVCVNTPTNFNGIATANNYYSRWYFSDDGQTQYYNNVTHTFLTPGTYELLFISRGYAGCEDTVRRNITIKSGPIINFTPDKPDAACIPHTVNFTNTSVGTNLKFGWNYGDGTPTDTINGNGNTSHTYTNFGTYIVTVYAKDTSTIDGCFAYKTFNYIRIYQPSVILNVIPPGGCLPLPVILTAVINNPSGTQILSYDWNFGDGYPISNTIIPNNFHLYNTAGSFPATVTINMQGGCSYTSLIKTVTVVALCDDDGSGGGGGAGGGGFTIGKTCADKYTILFTDTVTNNIPLSWDFGDGTPLVTTGILNPISHTFTPPQKIFIVTVIRQDTLTNIITTSQKRIKIIDEKADFIPNLFDICKDKNVLFNTIGIDSSFIKNYTWDFGDGTPRQVINNALNFSNYGTYLNGNTNHTYTTNGNFFVKLIIEDKLGCKDSLQYAVPINVAGPIAKFSALPLTSCASPLLTTFTNGSVQNGAIPITEWQWTFGDGTPTLITTIDSLIPHSYTGGTPASFYTVKLKIKDAIGCEADTTKINYIKIYNPKADFFSYNTLQCNNYTALFYGYISSAINPTYQWDFGDGIISAPTTAFYIYHTYATDNNYNIKLIVTDENGCKDSITKLSYINIVKPVADFKINDTLQCAPASITFADSSKYATSYLWDFGDGSGPSSSPNPAPHIYGTPGFYDVKLTITGPNGCADVKTKRIRVRGPIGNLSAGPNQGCRPFTLSLNITGGNFISTYAWDYADGTPVVPSTTAASTNHIYNYAGKYLPNIVLTSPEGCPFTLKIIDTVFVDSLLAKFTAPQNTFCQISNSQIVNFTNLTTLPSFSNLLNSTWHFGDGTSIFSIAATVSHTYTGYGIFYPYLATQSKYGCIDTFKLAQPIVINAKPIPSITGANVYCLKPASSLQYNGTYNSPNPIVKFVWKIDADSVANTQNLNINYRTPGTHILKYIITTDKGCIDSIIKTIIIDSVFTQFTNTPLKFCGPTSVLFTNQSTNFAALQNYTWTFGDALTENNLNLSPTHLYNYTGSYNVKLYMQTVNGCFADTTIIAAVKIDSIPKAIINTASIFCLKPLSTIQFTNTVITLNPIVKYRWYIDNALVGNLNNLDIDYRIPGTHTISLYIETDKGCNDSTFKTFIVDSVVTKFTNFPAQFCGPKLVTFTNLTTQFATTQSFYWNFGDGSPQETTNLNPTHLYNYTGTYNVKLYMQTINGCFADTTIIAAVKIDSIPTAKITGNALECSPGNYLYSSATSFPQNIIAAYQWKIDGNIVATTPNLNYNFNAGTHIINLKTITNKGCEKDTTKTIQIDSLVAAFNIPFDTKCGVPSNILFNQTSFAQYGIAGYLWNFGNASTINTNLPNPIITYNAAGVYPISLKIISATGCDKISTQVSNVTIYAKPILTINGLPSACANTVLNFRGNISGTTDQVINKEWKVNGVVAGTTDTLNYLFTTAGVYNITFNVKTQYGCDVTEPKTVTIHPLPVPNATPQVAAICLGSSIMLSAQSGTTYSWSSPVILSGISDAASPAPSVLPTTIGNIKYYVLVTNQFGCKKTDSVLIKVQQHVNLTYNPPITICEKANTQLVANGNTNTFKWSPSAGLNDSTLRNPIATPVQTTNYRVVGYSNNVCKNDTGFVLVTIQPIPTVNAGPDVNAVGGVTVQLNAIASSSVINYLWSPSASLSCNNCPNPQFINVDKTTTFKVKVFTQYGCTNADEVTVFVLCGKGAIYLPNAFTPNGDGKNDRFAVVGFGVGKVKSLTIFNRYGDIVFQRKNFIPVRNDVTNSWDGKVKGQDVSVSTTFVYIAEVTCDGEETFILKNTVILIR